MTWLHIQTRGDINAHGHFKCYSDEGLDGLQFRVVQGAIGPSKRLVATVRSRSVIVVVCSEGIKESFPTRIEVTKTAGGSTFQVV